MPRDSLHASRRGALRVVSQFNDWVQARLFDSSRLAETYPESAVARPVHVGSD